jgi:hypothetical protein
MGSIPQDEEPSVAKPEERRKVVDCPCCGRVVSVSAGGTVLCYHYNPRRTYQQFCPGSGMPARNPRRPDDDEPDGSHDV